MTVASKTPTTTYRLRIRPLHREDDDIRHLRALLKTLLRRHHFRVVEIERELAGEGDSP
jgi:hypothetical protein